MKRYLALCPDAPNAKAAQEKLYIWEEKAKKAASQSPAGSPSVGTPKPTIRK
jgi:hypothetical protein